MSSPLVEITIVLMKGKEVTELPGSIGHAAPYKETSVVVTDSYGGVQAPVMVNGSESPAWTVVASVVPAKVAVNLVHAVKAVRPVLASVVATDLDVNGHAMGEAVRYVYREGDGVLPKFVPTIGMTVTGVVPEPVVVAPVKPIGPVVLSPPPVSPIVVPMTPVPPSNPVPANHLSAP